MQSASCGDHPELVPLFARSLPSWPEQRGPAAATGDSCIADAPDSPSLSVLRDWINAWEDANRPAPETYTPTLVGRDEPGLNGWNLRLAR
ncbi:hypothetical protein [Streptomyces sp. NPDC055299]